MRGSAKVARLVPVVELPGLRGVDGQRQSAALVEERLKGVLARRDAAKSVGQRAGRVVSSAERLPVTVAARRDHDRRRCRDQATDERAGDEGHVAGERERLSGARPLEQSDEPAERADAGGIVVEHLEAGRCVGLVASDEDDLDAGSVEDGEPPGEQRSPSRRGEEALGRSAQARATATHEQAREEVTARHTSLQRTKSTVVSAARGPSPAGTKASPSELARLVVAPDD